jgi:hypothetical protein
MQKLNIRYNYIRSGKHNTNIHNGVLNASKRCPKYHDFSVGDQQKFLSAFLSGLETSTPDRTPRPLETLGQDLAFGTNCQDSPS